MKNTEYKIKQNLNSNFIHNEFKLPENFLINGLENHFNSLQMFQPNNYTYPIDFYLKYNSYIDFISLNKCLYLLKETNKLKNLELLEYLSFYMFSFYSKKFKQKIVKIINHLNFFLDNPETTKFDFSRLKYSRSIENKSNHLINILIKYTFILNNKNFSNIILYSTREIPIKFKHFYKFLLEIKFILFSFSIYLNSNITEESILFIIKLFFYYFINSLDKNYIKVHNLTYDNLFIYSINKFFIWLYWYKKLQNNLELNADALIDKRLKTVFKKNYNTNQLNTPVSIAHLFKQRKEKLNLTQNKLQYIDLSKLHKKRFTWMHLTKNILWVPIESKAIYFWRKKRFWINAKTYHYAYNIYYNQLYPVFLELKSKLFIDNYFLNQKLTLSYYEEFQIAKMIRFKKDLFPTAPWLRCSSTTLIKYFIYYYIESLPKKWIKKNKKFLQALVSNNFFSIKTRYRKNIPPKVILATYLYNMSFSNNFSYISGIYAVRRFLEVSCQDSHLGQTYNLRILLYWFVTDDFIKKNISTCLNFLRLGYLASGKPLRLFRIIDKYFESYKSGISKVYAGYILRLARYLLINMIFEDILRFIARDNKQIFSKYTNFSKLGVKEFYNESFIKSRLNIFGINYQQYPITNTGIAQADEKLKFKYYSKEINAFKSKH